MPRTLREMLDKGERVRLFCLDCCRDRTVSLSSIVSDSDADSDVTLRDIQRRLRCSRCDSKRVDIMVPSHQIGPLKSDRERRLETNLKQVPCPECKSGEVSRFGPQRRPIINEPRFMPGSSTSMIVRTAATGGGRIRMQVVRLASVWEIM